MTTVSDPIAVTAARITVAQRRGELIDTAQILQARLAPRTLVADAWGKAKDKGADLAEEAVDAVKARPAVAGGVAAALAMFLAREPIKQAASKIYEAITSKSDTIDRDPALVTAALIPMDEPDPPAPRRMRARRVSLQTEIEP